MMDMEIIFCQKKDLVLDLPEMIIKWRKTGDTSFLVLECHGKRHQVDTAGRLEQKMINLVKSVSLSPFLESVQDYTVLDGASYTMSVKQGDFAVDTSWHETIPDEWKGFQKLINYMVVISNSEKICSEQDKTIDNKITAYIDGLDFDLDSLKQVLQFGIALPSGLSHEFIAAWCSRFAQYFRDEFDADRIGYDHKLRVAEEIAEDVDAQWELFLMNTYSSEELQHIDHSSLKLPFEWFQEWLEKLDKIKD